VVNNRLIRETLKSRGKAIGTLLILALFIIAARSFDLQNQLRSLLRWIDSLGNCGPLMFIIIYILACVLFLPGSLLTLFRDNGDLPRMVLGQAVVLTVDGETSTVKILHSSREVRCGDRAEVMQQ